MDDVVAQLVERSLSDARDSRFEFNLNTLMTVLKMVKKRPGMAQLF